MFHEQAGPIEGPEGGQPRPMLFPLLLLSLVSAETREEPEKAALTSGGQLLPPHGNDLSSLRLSH